MKKNMPRPNTFYPLYFDHVHPYSFWQNVFTKEECEKIIDLGTSIPLECGETVGNNDFRKSSVSWIFPDPEINWIFEKLSHHINVINDQFFKFDIFGLAEGLQFTKYEAPDNKYQKHTDRLFNTLTRKISVTVQLSEPETYTGGDLCLYQEESPTTLLKSQGTLIAFPSFMLHEVTPVETGTRYSLVAWVTGKPFR